MGASFKIKTDCLHYIVTLTQFLDRCCKKIFNAMKLKSPLKLHIRLHGCIVTTKYEVDLLDVFISDIKIVLL